MTGDGTERCLDRLTLPLERISNSGGFAGDVAGAGGRREVRSFNLRIGFR